MNVKITMEVEGRGDVYRNINMTDKTVFPEYILEDMLNTLCQPTLEEIDEAKRLVADDKAQS